MSVQSRDLEQFIEHAPGPTPARDRIGANTFIESSSASPSPADFVFEWSSQRASAGYVCRYCGGERMWYRRAVRHATRHATTKKHLDAYNSRADPVVNSFNWLLQPTAQALSSGDEADLVDFNENPAETGTISHSLVAWSVLAGSQTRLRASECERGFG
ncbi:BZ3500_MvSof-1268-A1-R1_Chr2-1g04216 [Microbotryum saponariae]|uniref:BZ3500_MvSof-1268-A1-R1_Chr2-1g04216 protein n=1 Tax=Microbotryum saponariae TaxID=289078 RepID=A0A2X0M1Z1_9BASI|nr:BZ3500_MvSof-1268-A1-R1_Chr2-1g04216 [Microbotryum saponariae]SCZ91203.1 BZ3501_MvSof-1269-A2-R1_Chr2-1g03872 [Microbotryum saponariae]